MRYALLISCSLLAGCNAVTENVVRANEKFQSMVYNSAERVQQWTDPKRELRDKRGQPETRYCYKSLGDIVCYNAPQGNMSNPLFGSQGYAAEAMPLQQQVVMVQEPVAAALPTASIETKVDAKLGAATSSSSAGVKEPLALMSR